MRPCWRWWLFCLGRWAHFRGWRWGLELFGWSIPSDAFGEHEGMPVEGEEPF